MRGGVAEHLHRVGILGGEDGELSVVVERASEIDQVAICSGDESLFRETRRNLLRYISSGGAFGDVAGGAVGQSNLNGVHGLSAVLAGKCADETGSR